MIPLASLSPDVVHDILTQNPLIPEELSEAYGLLEGASERTDTLVCTMINADTGHIIKAIRVNDQKRLTYLLHSERIELKRRNGHYVLTTSSLEHPYVTKLQRILDHYPVHAYHQRSNEPKPQE